MNGYRDALGWGVIIWLIGYLIGIALFAIAPVAMIGWIILPIGTVIALAVLLKKSAVTIFSTMDWRRSLGP